jgi:predicted NBD/HSP70 family sugar kinase
MEHLLEKATHQQTRDHNTRLVFRAIYDEGEISRAELARRTGLTRTTVSHVAGSLLDRGLIEEIGTGQFSGGRLPIMLQVVDDSRLVLALHLDSAMITGALIGLRGTIHQRVALPVADHRVDTLVAQLSQAINLLFSQAERPILGIGLGMPGVVDTTHGVVRRAVNFGLTDVPLRQLLQSRHKLPVYLGNEVHLTALAEYTFGARGPSSNLIAISVNIGIGAGIVLRGELFHGDTYGAGEIGHVVVVEQGRPCKCGNVGCLETVASTHAIICAAQELALRDPTSALLRFAADPRSIDLAAISHALAAGDAGVREIVTAAGHYLGLTVASAVGLLNIERIVLTGSISRLGSPFRDAVAAGFARRVLASLAASTRVELLPESADAVLQGASALLLNHELGLVRVASREAD